MKISRGKYISFLDSDDVLVPNALETLYDIAEQTNADVLHLENFIVSENRSVIRPDIKTFAVCVETGSRVNKPELITEDIGERIIQLTRQRLSGFVWNKFYRRDFLVENDIDFPNLRLGEDSVFFFKFLCLAKRYVRVPNPVYIYRIRQDSLSHKPMPVDEGFYKETKRFLAIMKIYDEFMEGVDFFVKHREFKHMALDSLAMYHIKLLLNTCVQQPPHVIEDLLRKELSAELGGNSTLFGYLLNLVCNQQAYLTRLQQTVSELQKQLGKT